MTRGGGGGGRGGVWMASLTVMWMVTSSVVTAAVAVVDPSEYIRHWWINIIAASIRLNERRRRGASLVIHLNPSARRCIWEKLCASGALLTSSNLLISNYSLRESEKTTHARLYNTNSRHLHLSIRKKVAFKSGTVPSLFPALLSVVARIIYHVFISFWFSHAGHLHLPSPLLWEKFECQDARRRMWSSWKGLQHQQTSCRRFSIQTVFCFA